MEDEFYRHRGNARSAGLQSSLLYLISKKGHVSIVAVCTISFYYLLINRSFDLKPVPCVCSDDWFYPFIRSEN